MLAECGSTCTHGACPCAPAYKRPSTVAHTPEEKNYRCSLNTQQVTANRYRTWLPGNRRLGSWCVRGYPANYVVDYLTRVHVWDVLDGTRAPSLGHASFWKPALKNKKWPRRQNFN